jgi:hypothetical protein
MTLRIHVARAVDVAVVATLLSFRLHLQLFLLIVDMVQVLDKVVVSLIRTLIHLFSSSIL